MDDHLDLVDQIPDFSYKCVCIRTDFTKETNRVADLYEEMKAGRYSIKISDYAGFQVKTAGLLKKALKEIHAIGGDYVSVLISQ